MLQSNEIVKKFFNELAPQYGNRYHGNNPYYNYFFNQRLHAATDLFEFQNKKILDIGAGTGPLFNHIKKHFQHFEYFACDISEIMLAQSSIPKHQQFIGEITELKFKENSFDYIFMLGVSSYLDKKKFEDHLNRIHQLLKGEGMVIVSFTNRGSLDHLLRAISKKILSIGFIKISPKKVMGQDFDVQTYSPNQIRDMAPSAMEIIQINWLNQTLTPFNHLFPHLSVKIANQLKSLLPNVLLPFFSTDFLLVLAKKELAQSELHR